MFRENKEKVETIIKSQEESTSLRLSGVQRLRDCCFILGCLTAILISIALLSFEPSDPSWSQTGWNGEVKNLGGQFGAWVADSLFFVFGSIAYPLPIVISVMTWIFFRKRTEDEPIDLVLWGSRLLGLVVVIITSCALADINFDDIWYFSSGGVIGDVITNLTLPAFNLLGTTLVLIFLWGAGFTLLSGVSWLSIVEWLGDSAILLGTALVNLIRGTPIKHVKPSLQDQDSPSAFIQGVDKTNEVDSSILASEGGSLESRFNIHIPPSAQIETVQKETSRDSQEIETALEEFNDVPTQYYDRPLPSNATIEELTYQAEQANDYAEDAGLSVGVTATHVNDNVELEHIIHPQIGQDVKQDTNQIF